VREEKTVLEVKDLRVNFHTYRGEVKALNGVDMKLYKREILGLVGESGCGKSVTALTILGLLPDNAYIIGGEILFKKEDLLKKSKEEKRILRANELATVFQDPLTYLNPVLKVKTQLMEVFMLNEKLLKQAVVAKKIHGKNVAFGDILSWKMEQANESSDIEVSKAEIKKMAKHLCVDLMKLVKLPDPERILGEYPFELSGGMRQRIMIAMALARRPSIFIADEITTAVDVTIQAQILHLMRELRDKIDASTIMITHDLSVAAEIADRIAVMYGGNLVEAAPTVDIFRKPLHPYTTMLMRSIPNVKKPVETLKSIPGTVPEMINPPLGCRFHPRCPFAMDKCRKKRPKLIEAVEKHEVACYLIGG
jgi:peptide/nickel transport system ATP-binding protein